MQMPKPKRIKDQKYLNKVKKMNCAHCGQTKTPNRDIVPMHTNPLKTKGTGIKSDDSFAVAGCVTCHAIEHLKGTGSIWENELALFYKIIETMTIAGKTFDGYSPMIFALKCLRDNWEE